MAKPVNETDVARNPLRANNRGGHGVNTLILAIEREYIARLRNAMETTEDTVRDQKEKIRSAKEEIRSAKEEMRTWNPTHNNTRAYTEEIRSAKKAIYDWKKVFRDQKKKMSAMRELVDALPDPGPDADPLEVRRRIVEFGARIQRIVHRLATRPPRYPRRVKHRIRSLPRAWKRL